MSDEDDVKTRADFGPAMPPPSSRNGSLPPAGKTLQQAGLLLLLLGCLICATVAAVTDTFSKPSGAYLMIVIMSIVTGVFSLMHGKAIDASTLAALLKR